MLWSQLAQHIVFGLGIRLKAKIFGLGLDLGLEAHGLGLTARGFADAL